MKNSLMKKGSQALALTLLSVCLSLGTAGLASAHSVSDTSLAKKPKHQTGQVYINPTKIKVTANSTGAFTLSGHHLTPLTTYTLSSADLGTSQCSISPTLGTVMTDVAGNFSQYFTVGSAGSTTGNTGNTAVNADLNAAISAAIALNGNAAFADVNNAITDNGGATPALTNALDAAMALIAVNTNANAVFAVSAINNAIADNAGTGNTNTSSSCTPGTYHISVQGPSIWDLYNASVRIRG